MTSTSTHQEQSTVADRAGSEPRRSKTSFGRRLLWLGPTGIVAATVLSVGEWLLVTAPGNNGSTAAALLALTMTLPVVLARRFPIAAATAIGVAAVVNGLVFDDVVRCGAAFPAALYIAFAVGARSRESGRGWAWTGLGFVIIVGGLVAQGAWDPALSLGADFLTFAIGLAAVSCGAGIGWSYLARRISARRTAEVG